MTPSLTSGFTFIFPNDGGVSRTSHALPRCDAPRRRNGPVAGQLLTRWPRTALGWNSADPPSTSAMGPARYSR